MIKGPLVYTATALAAILLILSMLIVVFPDSIQLFGVLASVVSIGVVIVLMLILFRTRRGA